jgi:hypothetical protein
VLIINPPTCLEVLTFSISEWLMAFNCVICSLLQVFVVVKEHNVVWVAVFQINTLLACSARCLKMKVIYFLEHHPCDKLFCVGVDGHSFSAC